MNGSYKGLLELEDHRGGRLRPISVELDRSGADPHVSPQLISRYGLRSACFLECMTKPCGAGAPQVAGIKRVNGLDPEEWKNFEDLSSRTTVGSRRRINLTKG